MVRTIFLLSAISISAGITALGYFIDWNWMFLFILFGPLILIGLRDMFQSKHAIKKNFPVIGNLRYLLEGISPEIQQYFVERRTDGSPINKNRRAIIYQRSKNLGATHPFGTEMDVYEEGYEFVTHSLYPVHVTEEPRIMIGEGQCAQPYSASLYNISAMSFGSLSKNAVMALNRGAQKGNFFHNTGEGGVSPYHLQGGDLNWQIGTGYFGCRNKDGTFSDEMFVANATRPEVKMIEVKLSQGAKPGHGGVLPGKKNTPEIAAIRGVEPGITILSPPSHSAFSDPKGLLEFCNRLRELSGGKPTGFKLCIGKPQEFEAICAAMKETGSYPDFISIDGGEGGTGAAPLEFANHVGLPLYVGLVMADTLLKKYGFRDRIKLIASGKIFTGFDMVKAISMGADLTQSARGFMLSIGCIHAQLCNTNTCPVGVATQNTSLMRGLNVNDKYVRCFNFHHNTVHSFLELMGATGAKHPSELDTDNIKRMAEDGDVWTYTEIIKSWHMIAKLTGEKAGAKAGVAV
ncbi:MAG: FMN-binding glutamate synthase family protein [Crocinitomicaceae bacterium]|nr:FMN-binding glutamate synthase family protein [Crocinitomicaceae bacterium]